MQMSTQLFCLFVLFRLVFLPKAQQRLQRLGLALTLGTACILAAVCYVDGKQPREGGRATRDSVLVRVVVCIVRALRKRNSWVGNEQRKGGMWTLQARSCCARRSRGEYTSCQCEAVLRSQAAFSAKSSHRRGWERGVLVPCVSWRYTVRGRAVGGAAGSQLTARQSTARPAATASASCFSTGRPQLQIGCVCWKWPWPWPGAPASRFDDTGQQRQPFVSKQQPNLPPRRDKKGGI